jgi:D-threonine aldolase
MVLSIVGNPPQARSTRLYRRSSRVIKRLTPVRDSTDKDAVTIADLPTPALCVDLDVLTRNIEHMAAFFRDRPCTLRPHVKAHKTPAIARLQAKAGCAGFTCATVAEGLVLARHGLRDLLIANEVVDPRKLDALRALAAAANVTVAVDSPAGVALIADLPIGVLIDVNVGLPRCGVPPAGALDLARAIGRTRLRLRGVMGYEGHAMGIADPAPRTEVARESMRVLLQVAADLRAAGFPIDVVSAGGTGTFDVTGTIPGVTEVQAGSYALMDTTYAKYGLPFGEALSCLTTVVSHHGRLAVLDAGLKTLAVDHGNPELPADVPASVLFLSDEHTTLAVQDGWRYRPGDRVRLRPSHVDPTVNLHDRLYAIRGDQVVEVWPVEARGYPAG